MNIQSVRPFIPSKDYEASKAFYLSLGFTVEDAGPDLSICTMGETTFFIQKFYNEELANNIMLQLVVSDIEYAMSVISGVTSAEIKHSEVTNESWGKVIYLWGPSGELWHVTELSH